MARLAGAVKTSVVMAAATSTRPAPSTKTPNPEVDRDEAMSAALSSAARQSGCCWARSTAAPATCGVAIEVPDSLA
jgi:hypothetical protein